MWPLLMPFQLCVRRYHQRPRVLFPSRSSNVLDLQSSFPTVVWAQDGCCALGLCVCLSNLGGHKERTPSTAPLLENTSSPQPFLESHWPGLCPMRLFFLSILRCVEKEQVGMIFGLSNSGFEITMGRQAYRSDHGKRRKTLKNRLRK